MIYFVALPLAQFGFQINHCLGSVLLIFKQMREAAERGTGALREGQEQEQAWAGAQVISFASEHMQSEGGSKH